MPNPHDNPDALRELQDAIYKERVLRARAMTESERLDAVFELTNFVFQNMLAGAMWQKGLTDTDEGWQEVRRRLDRLQKMHDRGRFTNEPPSGSPAPGPQLAAICSL